MLVTYLRSSLLGAYAFCPHRTYLEYSLGLQPPSGFAAAKGTCTHKALELLARRKLAEQQGDKTVQDHELKLEWPTHELTPEEALDRAYAFYSHPERTIHRWYPRDRDDCSRWLRVALTHAGGAFSPLRRTVVAPEQYFDLTIDRPWARYAYTVGEHKLEGQLAIRGTMDLISEVGPNMLELCDYKTGARKDWATGKEKDYDSLQWDDQLLFYYYALRQLFPSKIIHMTIFYLNEAAPFTMSYGEEHLEKAAQMIEERFNKIRQDQRPRLIYPDWKCSKLCAHFKTHTFSQEKSDCFFIRDEVVRLGLDRCTAQYADLKRATSYGSGGGKTHD